MSFKLYIFEPRRVDVIEFFDVDQVAAERQFHALTKDPAVMSAALYGPEGFINSYQKP